MPIYYYEKIFTYDKIYTQNSSKTTNYDITKVFEFYDISITNKKVILEEDTMKR